MSRTRIAGLIAAVALPLAACAGGPFEGFTPMYATAGLSTDLSRIDSQSVQGRQGQLLRESLDDALAKDRTQPPLYWLNMKVKETRIPRGLRIDNVANRYELQLRTDYALIDLQNRTLLHLGNVVVSITYDSADQPYAGIAANLDAQERAADETAQKIRLAMAAYFLSPDKEKPKPIPARLELDGSERGATSQSGNAFLGDRMGAQYVPSAAEQTGVPDAIEAPPAGPARR